MKKKLSLLLVVVLMFSSISFALPVDNTEVYGKALQKMGVISGDEKGNLKGQEILTREQSLVTLESLLGVDELSKYQNIRSSFVDVPVDYWANGAIVYAHKHGLTHGISYNQFGLGNSVTLQEYATFMLRSLGYVDASVYNNAIPMAKELGILRDVKIKNATDLVTRDDAFAMLFHTLECNLKDSPVRLDTMINRDITSEHVGELSYPLVVKNYDGSDLLIKERPNKVASLILGTDELLLGLDPKWDIVGLSGQKGNSKSVSLVADSANLFPKMDNNIEIILKQKPTLVIGSSWIKKELLQQIKDSGIDYYGYKTPNTIAEQKQIIKNFAKVLGSEKKGEEIIANWNQRMEAIEAKAKKIREEDKLTVLPYNMHGSTSGKGTIVDEVITLIGAKNAAAEAGLEKRAKLSKEKLIEINPDVILVMAWGMNDLTEFNNFVDDLKRDPALQGLKAVKEDRIVVEDGRYLTIVTQHLIDGIEVVAKAVYPEVYSKK